MLNSTDPDFGETYVYGDLEYTGPVPVNTINVQGTITAPFEERIEPVYAPTWSTFNASPTVIKSTMAHTGQPCRSPCALQCQRTHNQCRKVPQPAAAAAGEESYVEVWVTGKLTVSGSGYIEQLEGVHVTYYVEEDITVSGSAFYNRSNITAILELNGVTPEQADCVRKRNLHWHG